MPGVAIDGAVWGRGVADGTVGLPRMLAGLEKIAEG